MTQSLKMSRIPVAALAICCAAALSAQVSSDEPVTVSTEHPRLLLRSQRLRLLKRERERTSMRWQQFEALVAGKAPMPERAFAYALYYQISGSAEFGKQAVQAALAPGGDLRQMALVFDWCQEILTEAQRRDLTARLEKSITDAPANDSVSTARNRAFAAIALFDHVPKHPQIELERIARRWWEARTVPALKAGRSVIAREDAYALWELLHVMRDNTLLELRESFPRFFKDFPIEHLISYYPAAFPGPENDYYIGAMKRPPIRTQRLRRCRARLSLPWWHTTRTAPKARSCRAS